MFGEACTLVCMVFELIIVFQCVLLIVVPSFFTTPTPLLIVQSVNSNLLIVVIFSPSLPISWLVVCHNSGSVTSIYCYAFIFYVQLSFIALSSSTHDNNDNNNLLIVALLSSSHPSFSSSDIALCSNVTIVDCCIYFWSIVVFC